jgi:type II secretory pathway pseudopilin PulG
MDTMTYIADKNKAFTLIEAVMSMVVVAVGTMAVVASLQYGDNAALRARIDARGSQEFARQTQWVMNYPSSDFRQIVESMPPSGMEEDSLPTSNPQILIKQPTDHIIGNVSASSSQKAFFYKTTLKVEPPPAEGDAYVLKIRTEWETPVAAGNTGDFSGVNVRTNMLEMEGLRKW